MSCRDPDLVKRIGAATALEGRATGIQYVFAPCVVASSPNLRHEKLNFPVEVTSLHRKDKDLVQWLGRPASPPGCMLDTDESPPTYSNRNIKKVIADYVECASLDMEKENITAAGRGGAVRQLE
ncbi:hypothetical protein AKJ16_DCAP10848 [Drosera capensis]